MSTYAVVISAVNKTQDGWESMRNSPTFYLDSKVQGIINAEHACKVAMDIANVFKAGAHCERISIYAINNDNGKDNYNLVWNK